MTIHFFKVAINLFLDTRQDHGNCKSALLIGLLKIIILKGIIDLVN